MKQEQAAKKSYALPIAIMFSLFFMIAFVTGYQNPLGKVIEGMDVVNKIAETPTDYMDRPMQDQIMKTVTVETFGETYPEPDKIHQGF